MRHTPGPWKAIQPPHDPQAWDVVTEQGGLLAKLVWGQVSAANARLMAAAPDLVAACEAALSYMSGGECTPQAEREIRQLLRAALLRSHD